MMTTHYYHDAQQSQAIDRYAIEQQKTPSYLLMKKAAFFAFQTLKTTRPGDFCLTILCGTGNNGGDGFMLAQYALLDGMDVRVMLFGSEAKISGDALKAYQELLALGLLPEAFSLQQLQQSDVIVDAIFGTGLNQPVRENLAETFQAINQLCKPIMALDVPSGLDASTGNILGAALQAQSTCTFISEKIGLVTHQGQDVSGEVFFSDLGLSLETRLSETPVAQQHERAQWLMQLPYRQASEHKGHQGSVGLIGGNYDMMGAIQMAAQSCLKSGAGFTRVFSQPEHVAALTQTTPELMCYSAEQLPDKLDQLNVIAAGPGLGQDDWSQQIMERILPTISANQPAVLDADALNWLATTSDIKPNSNWILTPHPGEAASLLGCTTAEIQNDRLAAIKSLHQQYGGIIVLKGNGSLIFDGHQMEVCTAGNPGMAVGGMGDVLTGLIASLVAQGMPLFAAACLGVKVHAETADELAQSHGQMSLTPTDVIHEMGYLLR